MGRYLVFSPKPSRSSRTSCNAARLFLGMSKLSERGHPHLSPLFTVLATSVSVCLCMPLLFPAFLPVGPFYPPSERLIVKKRGALKCKPHEKTKGLGKSDSFNNNKHTSTNLLREINEQEKRTPQHPHLSLLQMDGGRDGRITIPRPPGGVRAVDQAEGENAAVCVHVCVCAEGGISGKLPPESNRTLPKASFPSQPKLQKLHPKLEVGVCNPLCGKKSMRQALLILSSLRSFGLAHFSRSHSPACPGNINFCTVPSLGSQGALL